MRRLLPVLLLSCGLPFAAHAQEPAAADPVILRVETGSVMVSQQGAEFVTVESDVSLQPEDRVLVPEGTAAALDYGQGCVVTLVTGAYPVAASCPLVTAQPAAQAAATAAPAEAAGTAPGAAAAGKINTALIVGGVAAALGIAAAAGGGGSDTPPAPPVSR